MKFGILSCNTDGHLLSYQSVVLSYNVIMQRREKLLLLLLQVSKRNYLNSLMSLKWKHLNGICFYRIYATLEKGLIECGTLLTLAVLS